MFEVNISTAFFIYLIIPLSIIFILWVISEYKQRTKSSQVESLVSMTCNMCLQVFIYKKDESIVQCPFCNSYNDVVKKD